MADTVINELVEWCGPVFEPPRGGDRQDYLEALMLAVDVHAGHSPEDEWDGLSKSAKDWFNECVDAMNKRSELPEPVMAANGHIDEDDDDDDDDLQDEDDDEDEDDANQHTIKEPPGSDKVLEAHAAEAAAEADNEAAEAAVDTAGKRKRGRPKKTENDKAKVERLVEQVKLSKPKPKKVVAPDPKAQGPGTTRYQFLTGDKDRYGFVAGTKTSEAIAMYEKGATCREVKDAMNGEFRNCLKMAAERGHRVERLQNGVMKLTHNSEF